MLSPFNTEQQRQTVRTREQAFNQVLREVCGQNIMCRFDDLAVFNYHFTSGPGEQARLLPSEPLGPGNARVDHLVPLVVGALAARGAAGYRCHT